MTCPLCDLEATVTKLSPSPGEFVVVTASADVSEEEARHMVDTLTSVLPSGVRAVVLFGGVSAAKYTAAELVSLLLPTSRTPS